MCNVSSVYTYLLYIDARLRTGFHELHSIINSQLFVMKNLSVTQREVGTV